MNPEAEQHKSTYQQQVVPPRMNNRMKAFKNRCADTREMINKIAQGIFMQKNGTITMATINSFGSAKHWPQELSQERYKDWRAAQLMELVELQEY